MAEHLCVVLFFNLQFAYIDVDKPPFEVTETGYVLTTPSICTHRTLLIIRWGEFEVVIRITFVPESLEKPLTIHHHLKLHPWAITDPTAPPGAPPQPPLPPVPSGEAVHAWQYDELVFTDPPKSFLDILMAHPPTPLPKVRKRGVPPHTSFPASIATISRGTPEFTAAMEREEADRLDSVKKDVVSQTEQQRALLIEKEKELAKLKRQLEAQ